jgi:hypothetical protein
MAFFNILLIQLATLWGKSESVSIDILAAYYSSYTYTAFIAENPNINKFHNLQRGSQLE